MSSLIPAMKKSEESTRAQLELAKQQGAVYGEALKAMDEEFGAEIRRVGEYEIAVVIEPKACGFLKAAGGMAGADFIMSVSPGQKLVEQGA